jgi:hypothetical protein
MLSIDDSVQTQTPFPKDLLMVDYREISYDSFTVRYGELDLRCQIDHPIESSQRRLGV